MHGGTLTYHLIVDDNSDFSSPVIEIVDLSSSTYTPSEISGGLLYWKVRSMNIGNMWGDWSETWSFTLSGPEAPTLLLPENGSTVNDLTPAFDWNDPDYAYRYHLIVDDNSDFSSPVYENTDLSSSTYTISTDLINVQYYWKVKAKNSSNVWGD